jgi:serine/threonine protein kinase
MLSDDRDPVDVLAEEFADRLRRGEHPSVSDYAAAHPDCADQLRELLPAVAQMEMLKRFRHPAAEKSLPDRLGDFRIVRELGRGGMGIVFEAVQESLGRPVALKVLARHAQLDPTRRERFVREAQAAARLHHTNIVPVFGVGEHDGLPYYVMQLIPGCGLHAVLWQWRQHEGLNRIPDRETMGKNPGTKPAGVSGGSVLTEPEVAAPPYGDWRFVAEVGIQAANALHYAHKQGVLHRDVKPANLILDGEIVWVADFGLAKMSNTDGLTATGDILGTLQYLPPECLAGDADARSDVYGLGATLYELLTLEPPYVADSPAKLIKLIGDNDPVPPRERNPEIPRDLETIVLKAMAREPSARYASAHELAEDLEAFLEDRPIKARRTTLVSRGLRWCRRNPAVASLALSTLVAISLAAIAGWVGYANTNAALGREADRRKDAEREQHKAELATASAVRAEALAQQKSDQLAANLKLSLETFGKVFEAAGGTGRQAFGIPLPPMGGPGGGPGRGPGGLGGPSGHGGGPPGVGPGGPGGPNSPNGGPAAESASDKAAITEAVLAFYDKFAKQNAAGRDLQFEAAKASRRVCEAHAWVNRPEKTVKAVAAFRRAVALLEPLVAQFPNESEYRAELVMTYVVAPPESYPGDRGAALRRAAELAEGNAWLTGTVQFRTGYACEQIGDRPGAENAYHDAVDSLASVEPAARPTNGQVELAFARYRLAAVLTERGQTQAARKLLEESVEQLSPFAERSENTPNLAREWLGMTYWTLAAVCEQLKDRTAAEQARGNAKQYGDWFGGPGGPKKDGPGGMWPGGGPWGGPWGGKKDGPPRKDGKKD